MPLELAFLRNKVLYTDVRGGGGFLKIPFVIVFLMKYNTCVFQLIWELLSKLEN